MNIARRKTRTCKVGDPKAGGVQIGSEHPVLIQTMTMSKTENIAAILEEIKTIKGTGCQLIRIAIPTEEAALAIPQIKAGLKAEGIQMPIVADIHFDPSLAITALEQGADKIRINPGNFYDRTQLESVINLAKEKNAAIRIGINTGSLERDLLEKHGHPSPEALCESAIRWVKFVEDLGFFNFVVSIKSTNAMDNIEANRLFAKESDVPLHLGVTEAGTLLPGVIKSAIGIGTLLQEGIGDTIRVSLTEAITEEIKACKHLLKALGLYPFEAEIISCPTCGRIEIDLKKLVKEVEVATAHIKEAIKISVLGCAVNGPGEAREADFGIAGGRGFGAIYYKGEVHKAKVPEAELVSELMKLIEEKLKTSEFKTSEPNAREIKPGE